MDLASGAGAKITISARGVLTTSRSIWTNLPARSTTVNSDASVGRSLVLDGVPGLSRHPSYIPAKPLTEVARAVQVVRTET